MCVGGGGMGVFSMNKFEQVSILGHQMSLAGGPCTVRSKLNKFEYVEVWGLGRRGRVLYNEVPCRVSLGAVQSLGVQDGGGGPCTVSTGHMPPRQTD